MAFGRPVAGSVVAPICLNKVEGGVVEEGGGGVVLMPEAEA